jgi:hypothetical protein
MYHKEATTVPVVGMYLFRVANVKIAEPSEFGGAV